MVGILSYRIKESGIEEFVLDLNLLYSSREDREKFEQRWKRFWGSDRYNPQVFKRVGSRLIYLSESWVPDKKDNRLPLLLLFGNPAPHSVVSRMYFAFEGKGREHRIWRIFRDISLLEFKDVSFVTEGSLFSPSGAIKEKFYNLNYQSPFRIGMAVYFSMSSPPSDPVWSGVGGLYKLFGKKTIKLIEQEELKRIKGIVTSFLKEGGKVIAFQKDAYNGIKELDSPDYTLKSAMEGKLKSRCRFNKEIEVVGVPPTRFLQGHKTKLVLKNAVKVI